MKLNQINNLEVILGDVNDEVNNLEFEGIVFDPPRSGLTNEMIESVLHKEVSQIIYISCNLKTLSRDIGLLLTNYKIKSIVPVKMFYQTTETETIVILERI